jgi:hypothetical protein
VALAKLCSIIVVRVFEPICMSRPSDLILYLLNIYCMRFFFFANIYCMRFSFIHECSKRLEHAP